MAVPLWVQVTAAAGALVLACRGAEKCTLFWTRRSANTSADARTRSRVGRGKVGRGKVEHDASVAEHPPDGDGDDQARSSEMASLQAEMQSIEAELSALEKLIDECATPHTHVDGSASASPAQGGSVGGGTDPPPVRAPPAVPPTPPAPPAPATRPARPPETAALSSSFLQSSYADAYLRYRGSKGGGAGGSARA